MEAGHIVIRSTTRRTGARSSATTPTSSEATTLSTATLSKPGTLIHARGREWVVLPDSTDDLLMARPVGGLDEEVTGILPAVETVASATFRLPTAADLGDFGRRPALARRGAPLHARRRRAVPQLRAHCR